MKLVQFAKVLLSMGVTVATLASAESVSVEVGLHAHAVMGLSTAEHPADFAPGGHDPNRKEAFQLQSIEPSVSLRYGDYLRGFATGTVFTDQKDDFQWEWEEYFLKAENLPGGIELRGGRFLNRVGLHNPTHLHGWSTVDAPLPHSLLLGEDGLSTRGGEVNFHFDTAHPTVLTVSFGQPPSHDHAHGHDHSADEEEDHGSDFGALEPYRLREDLVTIGLRRLYRYNDFHHWTLAAFGATADNELGADSWLAGAGLEYRWRENGLEPGGRAIHARVEYIRLESQAGHAHVLAEEDHDHHHLDHDHHELTHGSISGNGVSAQVAVEWTPRFHPFARVDRVQAIDELGLPAWTRYTLGVTLPLTNDPYFYLRLQGNADERGDASEQSVWLQAGFSWGGAEVR